MYLLDEWDAEKNTPLTPLTVSYGSKRKLWWRCEQGHCWQATVYSRSSGTGCPYCAGVKVGQGNDLASLYPELAAQWDMRKNAPKKPSDVLPESHQSVWWRCEKGHSWRAIVRSRVAGCGCPVCAGWKVLPGFNDLASKSTDVAAQWHPVLNGSLTPDKVTVGSHRRVWWQCANGHVWKALIYSRAGVQKCGCPVCAGRYDGSHKVHYDRILKEQERA